jgi:hypothetical protein
MRRSLAVPVASLALLVAWAGLVQPAAVEAHPKGLYKTKAEAEQRARELGCQGTHPNNGLWMPCSDEAHFHQELRQQ